MRSASSRSVHVLYASLGSSSSRHITTLEPQPKANMFAAAAPLRRPRPLHPKISLGRGAGHPPGRRVRCDLAKHFHALVFSTRMSSLYVGTEELKVSQHWGLM
ncbi:unnamed protein product [Pleuronectes platessa]|uniref:Uncharacterized protein n=1 Tax=Pleuronectes platessa TaxID=8262 RepID=A0A9N7VDZ8_PLEPL|nr:unnamed protein product [Pleuronectes platessa]